MADSVLSSRRDFLAKSAKVAAVAGMAAAAGSARASVRGPAIAVSAGMGTWLWQQRTSPPASSQSPVPATAESTAEAIPSLPRPPATPDANAIEDAIETKILSTEKESPGLVLGGIISGEGAPMAIINQRIVREGDSIDGAQVMRIFDDKVVLSFAGKSVELTLD